MEQRRKREWAEEYPDLHNPHADLPEMRILTFDLQESMPTSYRYETEDMAFNFWEFFQVWTGDESAQPISPVVPEIISNGSVDGCLCVVDQEDGNMETVGDGLQDGHGAVVPA